jgi:thiol-disulfide isomerase/thioredoxin
MLSKPLPSFALYDLDSNFFSNETLKGKVVLLSIWEIGCPPCMWEIPHFNDLKKDLEGKDFALISMTPFSKKMMTAFKGAKKEWPRMDTILTSFKKHIHVSNIDFPIIPTCDNSSTPEYLEDEINLRAYCDFIKNKFNVFSYPTTFIIDKKGIVREIYFGFDQYGHDVEKYKVKIDELLKE